jgi:hypothetical protein
VAETEKNNPFEDFLGSNIIYGKEVNEPETFSG